MLEQGFHPLHWQAVVIGIAARAFKGGETHQPALVIQQCPAAGTHAKTGGGADQHAVVKGDQGFDRAERFGWARRVTRKAQGHHVLLVLQGGAVAMRKRR